MGQMGHWGDRLMLDAGRVDGRRPRYGEGPGPLSEEGPGPSPYRLSGERIRTRSDQSSREEIPEAFP